MTCPRGNDPEGGITEAEAVSNNGVVCGSFMNADFIFEGDTLQAAGIWNNGVWVGLPAISDDGTIVAGYVAKGNMVVNTCTWTNGILDPLFPGCEYGIGGRAWKMSGDGSLLGGWIYDEQYNQGPGIWSPELTRLGQLGQTTGISQNSKYACGTVIRDENDESYLPFLWTKEEGLTILPIHEGYDSGAASSVSNDGTVVGYSFKKREAFNRQAFIIKDGEFYDLQDWLEQNFGWENNSGVLMYTPMSISANADVICGWGDGGDRVPWIITIDDVLSMPGNLKIEEMENTGSMLFSWQAPSEWTNQERDFMNYAVYLNGNKLDETTNTSFVFKGLTTGKYVAGVKAVYSSGSSEMATKEFEYSVGIENNKQISDNISIISNGKTVIVKNNNNISITAISVYDLSGREINYFSNIGNKDCEMNLSNYQSGIYIIKISAGEKITSLKIIL